MGEIWVAATAGNQHIMFLAMINKLIKNVFIRENFKLGNNGLQSCAIA